MADWGALYAEHADDVVALAGDLSEDRLAVVVPATPEWTVRQLLQHLAGGPADILAGRMDGAPGPAWSSRHVDERKDRSVAELCAEIEENKGPVAAGADEHPAAVWDIVVHHCDLHEALGLGRPDEHLWRPVLEAVRDRVPPETAEVEDYELFRGVFSRRSRGQLAAWNTGANEDDLAAMCIFGPRDDDQPVI